MRLTRAGLVPLLLLATLPLVACEEDGEPTGPTIAAFAGVWTATSIRYTSTANQARTLDIVQVGGALSLTISSTGSFTGTFRLPTPAGVQTIPVTGQVTLNSSTAAVVDFNWPQGVTPPITDFTATYTLSGNNLTFTRPDATFQFPGQAAAEAAVLLIAMVRA